jgi:hypothetical protein
MERANVQMPRTDNDSRVDAAQSFRAYRYEPVARSK